MCAAIIVVSGQSLPPQLLPGLVKHLASLSMLRRIGLPDFSSLLQAFCQLHHVPSAMLAAACLRVVVAQQHEEGCKVVLDALLGFNAVGLELADDAAAGVQKVCVSVRRMQLLVLAGNTKATFACYVCCLPMALA